MNDFDDISALPHRAVTARLATLGWNVCGVGDWATVWRSPDGRQAARVCPFEPAYEVFVRLCRRLEGNPALPRVDFDAPLPGGGRLTVMEFLFPAEPSAADAVQRRWADAVPGDPVTEVRAEAERLDAESARTVPFWGGLDHNAGNIMTDLSGEPKLVDLFYVAGLDLFAALRERPQDVAAAFAPEQRRYLADIGAVTRLAGPEEIDRYRLLATELD